MSSWKRLNTKIVYQNQWMTVHEDSVMHPDGRPGIYGWIETPPAVFIVAIDNHGKIVLVQQTRYVTNLPSWELPAGSTDGQPALEAAKIELAEEAHLHADKWDILDMQSYPWQCFAPEYNILLVAHGLHEVRNPPEDTDEVITAVKHVSWHETMAMIKSGEIKNGQTITALMLAGIHLGYIE
jgi:8-oxo-dGTP pyrophosphatase MutT (NUDIX family)